jgi:hypothetical protein
MEHRLGHALEPSIHVLHRCDNPGCVNPAHLFLGTNDDNMADKIAKGRQGKKLTKTDIPKILADERPHRHIAADYGVDRAMIGAIKRGERWKHAGHQTTTPEGL